jgi:hypothetical protein
MGQQGEEGDKQFELPFQLRTVESEITATVLSGKFITLRIKINKGSCNHFTSYVTLNSEDNLFLFLHS